MLWAYQQRKRDYFGQKAGKYLHEHLLGGFCIQRNIKLIQILPAGGGNRVNLSQIKALSQALGSAGGLRSSIIKHYGLFEILPVNNIFLIGPASVGKSTVGKRLAERLGLHFIDIDSQFCSEVTPVPDYVKKHGYAGYCERSSELADDLIARFATETVFATPAGFLVHDELPHLVEKHIRLVDTNATSVLLLPSEDPLETVDMIVSRQLNRWPEAESAVERRRYICRHGKYKRHGTIRIVGQYDPEEVVGFVVEELQRRSGGC